MWKRNRWFVVSEFAKICDEIVIEYHPNFFSYNSDKSIWYTNLSHVPTENDCFTSLFFWSGKKHCRFGGNFSKKSAHRLAWLQLWPILKIQPFQGTKMNFNNKIIQNPNSKGSHITFINFWEYKRVNLIIQKLKFCKIEK